jgi:Xaa-Pro aminopeptidase
LFQHDFTSEEFAARRGRIVDSIGPGACALLQGAAPARGFDVFRQTNEFYYCCGIETPQAYLLLEAATRRTTLFLPHRPPGRSAEGASLAAEDADLIRARTGIDAVCGVEALWQYLNRATAVYTPHQAASGFKGSRDELTHADGLVAADPWDGRLSREQHFIELLHRRYPRAAVRDLCPILDGLRAVKSPAEVALCRQAGHLSAQAVAEAMRATRVGLIEGQLGALATYLYLLNGARGEGYRAIIGGGGNTWHWHYFRNDCPLADGEMVLMDTAPDYRYYTSDIGRMWPNNGTYTPVQRELYGFIVEYHKATLARIRPGVTADEVMDEAAAAMAPVIDRLPFSKDIYRQAARRCLTFRGHMSHPVGMEVHDCGGYRDKVLTPGMVFAVDPQMWIPEEQLYIRVEDTVAVTDTGMENFTAAAPLELSDVEATIRNRHRPLPMMEATLA